MLHVGEFLLLFPQKIQDFGFFKVKDNQMGLMKNPEILAINIKK